MPRMSSSLFSAQLLAGTYAVMTGVIPSPELVLPARVGICLKGLRLNREKAGEPGLLPPGIERWNLKEDCLDICVVPRARARVRAWLLHSAMPLRRTLP